MADEVKVEAKEEEVKGSTSTLVGDAVDSKLDSDKAKEILIKERDEKIKKCTKELQAILDQNGCALDVTMMIKQNAIVPRVDVIVKG